MRRESLTLSLILTKNIIQAHVRADDEWILRSIQPGFLLICSREGAKNKFLEESKQNWLTELVLHY